MDISSAHLWLLLSCCICISSAAGLSGQCIFSDTASGIYSKVMQPTLSPSHLEDLPGFTRSVYERDHALITPESQVFSSLPGWKDSQGAYLITPAMGSHFTMCIVRMEGSSASANPSPGVERFIFVISGEVILSTEAHEKHSLPVNWFAYVPANVTHSILSTASPSYLVIFERKYSRGAAGVEAEPQLITGDTETQTVLETPGEVFVLRKLLPTSYEYDFNVHVMDFEPGEYLNVKEVHYYQHGLLLLQGRGIYRLGDKWYPVQAGDAIWMAPFTPQWYGALGRTKSRYLLYKDINRDPID